jgi:hypothetical protein
MTHILDGLPDEVVVARDHLSRPSQVLGTLRAGFLLESRFYTRSQAAALVSRSEVYA